MNKKQQILAEIRKACPETMELKFGCYIKTIKGNVPFVGSDKDAYLVSFDNSKSKLRYIDEGCGCCSDWDTFNINEIEILGSQLHLEHLLRTIDRLQIIDFHLCVEPKIKITANIDGWNITQDYNFSLSLDQNLDNEERCNFIYKLIIKE